MSARNELIDAFLANTDWAAATRTPLAGDASNRRYQRLRMTNGTTAVFMDAPPEKGEDVRPFASIARHLGRIGLSAPEILFEDARNGFLILEDLGDDLFARVVARHPDIEDTLYTAATDALIHLHRAPAPALPVYDARIMTEYASLAFSRYKSGVTGVDEEADTVAFKSAFEPLLARLTEGPNVLVQRDYHAENLLWLPDRTGIARVGMLDFQDAMLGHPAYDLVSVLQDARRDVPVHLETRMIDHYIARSDFDPDSFRAAYAALGVQRNLRILGVFARLSLDLGKPDYIDLIPRVWGLLQRDLDHPALSDVSSMIRASLPEPTPQGLDRLKSP